MINELTKNVILSKVFELIDFKDYENASILLLDLRKIDKFSIQEDKEKDVKEEPEYDEYGYGILNELHSLIRPISEEMFTDTKILGKHTVDNILDYIETTFILRARKSEALNQIKDLRSLNNNLGLSMSNILDNLTKYINFDYLSDNAIKALVLGFNKYDEIRNNSIEILNKVLYNEDVDYIEVYTDASKEFLEELKETLGNPIGNRTINLINSAFYELAEELDLLNHPVTLADYNDDYEMDNNELKEYINELSEYAYCNYNYLIYALNNIDKFNNTKRNVIDNTLRLLNPRKLNYYLLKELFLKDKEMLIDIYNNTKDIEELILYYTGYNRLMNDSRCKRIFIKTIKTFLDI